MSSRFLFTGEENYLLRKELTRRSSNFLQKYGPDTVISLSLGEYSPQEIVQILCSGGLFSDQKLIIVHDIPGTTTSPAGTTELEDLIIANRSAIYSDYLVIFVSTKPDKRKKSYKFFSEYCEIKTFNSMDMRSLPKFLSSEFDEAKTTKDILTKDHIEYIVALVGKDGGRLSTEIKKIAHYLSSTGEALTEDVIKRIVTPSQESSAFELLDELIAPSNSEIFKKIDILITNGESWQALQGGLLRGLKTLLAYGESIQRGQDPKSLKLPPFTVNKYAKYRDSIIRSLQGYYNLYRGLIDFDYQVKTGQIDDQSYWLVLKSLLVENQLVVIQ